MKTVVGIFNSSSTAERGVVGLAFAGIPSTRIRTLAPGDSETEIHSLIPTSDTEQAGMGRAIGGLVGAVVGAVAVLALSTALQRGANGWTGADYFLAALAAAVGAAVGAFAGGALEDRLSPGLPKDEIYFYEESLRRGRSVVFVFASGREQEEAARRALKRAGALSLDAGDENWRVGLSRAPALRRANGRRAG